MWDLYRLLVDCNQENSPGKPKSVFAISLIYDFNRGLLRLALVFKKTISIQR